MKVSMVGSSQVNLSRIDIGDREVGLCSFSRNLNFAKISYQKNCVSWSAKSFLPLICKASVISQVEAVVSEKVPAKRIPEADKGLRLYVGLPLDAVSSSNMINYARAIEAGLKALKLLGVDGVELPIWWGVAEKEAMGQYNWTGYLALAEMIKKIGLKLHVSLCFHAAVEACIPLPQWVSRIGESQPDIFFTDRFRQQYKDCLSLSVDELPVLDGKTPIQVYKDFCENFKIAFSSYLGSTITGISIGLGPDGELRYPSHHHASKDGQFSGAGEFQCCDKNMHSNLKQHAETVGNPLWGLSGPHDAPKSDEMPIANSFFKEHGGSWETEYGDFFLSWYSKQLVSHGNCLLSLASSCFSNADVTVSGKVPLIYSWYRSRSHPAELTAGIYNTVSRDGYDEIVEMFSKSSCKIILPGMDLTDEHQPKDMQSSPESVLKQIISSCKKHGVAISGQNVNISGNSTSFEQIKKNLMGENAVDLFTYQRMGGAFFSPEHFPSFTNLVRSLSKPQSHPDDLPVEEVEPATQPGKKRQMQTA